MSNVKRTPGHEGAFKVLDFISKAVTRPFTQVVAEVDRTRAAQVIQMPNRSPVAKASVEKPAVEVVSKVAECIDKLFPTLRGAVRQQMISAVSRQISEDPHARQLI